MFSFPSSLVVRSQQVFLSSPNPCSRFSVLQSSSIILTNVLQRYVPLSLSSGTTVYYTLPKRYRGGGNSRVVIYKVGTSAKKANKDLNIIAAHNASTSGGDIGDAKSTNIPISGIGAVFGYSINRDIDIIANRTKNVQLREHLRTIDLDDLPGVSKKPPKN